jgi:homoserine O-acetyltransferase/O-succinyltransferase
VRSSTDALERFAQVTGHDGGKPVSDYSKTMTWTLAVFAALTLLGATPLEAQMFAVTEHQFMVRNFRLVSGDTLPEVRIRYRTIGTPRKDAQGRISNAVLVLHGSSGDASQVLAPSFTGPLLAAGQPLDAAMHYLIFPDNIGNGGSTKPSDGLRARFPKYGYTDMVELQHRLVTQHLGIARLKLIIGISMGGMHAWLWGARYPDAMQALVPIAAMPTAIQGRNLLWRTILTQAIRNDPEWNEGNYTKQPSGFLSIMPMFDMLVQSPVRLGEALVTRERAKSYLEEVIAETREDDDANNILYRFESSYDFNVEPDLERITAPLLTILFADDELNPPELGTMERAMARVKNGRMVLVPAGPETEGHRTQVKADVWREHLRAFMKALPQ